MTQSSEMKRILEDSYDLIYLSLLNAKIEIQLFFSSLIFDGFKLKLLTKKYNQKPQWDFHVR